MKTQRLGISLLFMILLFVTVVSNGQKTREEIPDRYKWNLEDIYKTPEEWNAAREKLADRLTEIEQFKGILTRSPADLLRFLNLSTELSAEVSRLFSYPRLNADLDTRNMVYPGMLQQIMLMRTEFGAMTAFSDPEILKADWSLIDSYIKSEKGLEPYRMNLENLFRMQKHSLSEPEERIMSLAGLTGRTPSFVYNTFSNAEMPVPEVVLSDGKKVRITKSQYSLLRELPVRDDRKKVFEAYWNSWENYKATFGQVFSASINTDMFNAKARHYNSTLEASLDDYNIPVPVYHSLVENVSKSLPAFHRYLAIKKRMLAVDTLKSYDLYAPVVKNVDLKFSYDEACRIVLEAFKPLGEEYVNTVKKAIDNRWIDVYPTMAKQSGAYSGSLRNVHPFILLNYNNLYDDVSTLAHELGHAMHSHMSDKNQPAPLAGYSIFVAEVASTFNEVLLLNYMLKTQKDENTRLSLLMSWLEMFRTTLFRQTQFAEFELKVHEAAWKGLPLTGETLSGIYLDIIRKYYGVDKGICSIDKYMEMEWAYIPHFFNSFYVYQYSTSFTASISLADRVMSGDKDAAEKYIAFLSSGGTDYPVGLLKKAGADMTTNEPFNRAIESMNSVMDEVERILDGRKID